MLGHEPPTQRRSTTAVRRPDCAICHASSFPLFPLPRMRMLNCSGCDMVLLVELPIAPQRIVLVAQRRRLYMSELRLKRHFLRKRTSGEDPASAVNEYTTNNNHSVL